MRKINHLWQPVLIGAVIACLLIPTAALSKEADRMVPPISIYSATADYDPVRYEYAQLVAAEWRKLGFEVKVEPLEWSRLNELVTNQQKYDTATIAWAGRAERIDPDHFIFVTLHSSQTGLGQYNETGYQNPVYDDLAVKVRQEIDLEKRRKHVFAAQAIAASEVPYAPIVHRKQLMAYNKKDFTNVETMMGEGLNSFWTFISITPTGERKTVVWAYPGDVTMLNPVAANATHDFQTMRLIYDTLTRVAPDGKSQLWAAEAIDVKSPTDIAVKLRPNMKFHDGSPVTAEDVKFTFDYLKAANSRYFMGLIKPVEKVDVVDKLTVRFTLAAPFAAFLSNTLGSVFILPKHIWEKVEPAKAMEFKNDKPVGSGPFSMSYWRRDEEMKLSAMKDHFNAPKVDAVLKVPYANIQGMVAAVEAGKADLTGQWIEPAQAEQLKKNASLAVIEVENHGFYYFPFNLRNKPFSDKAVRRALTLAVPRKAIIEKLLEGYGTPAYSIIGPSNAFWHNPDVEKLDYSIEKAKEELKKAGYEWNKDGRVLYPK
jgi:peptide/nickel transport system substrate-binding protein